MPELDFFCVLSFERVSFRIPKRIETRYFFIARPLSSRHHWQRERATSQISTDKALAALPALLASDKAAYVTGQAIACDGGLLQSI